MMLKGTILIVLAIGINVTLVSGDCSYMVKADFLTKNNAWDVHENKYGYYYKKPGTVNGKAHYESKNGKHAIWYKSDGNGVSGSAGFSGFGVSASVSASVSGRWSVGSKRDLGKNLASFTVTSLAECPSSPGYSWEYVDQYDNWIDADKGFSIWSKNTED